MSKKKIKNKKYLLVIFFIILILLSFAIYVFISKRNIKDIFEYKDKLVIESGSDIPTANDYLYKNLKKDKEIIWENVEIIDNKVYKVGKYQGSFKYNKKVKKVTLIVKDTLSPSIENVKDYEMLSFEEVPDMLSEVKASDNSNEDIKIDIIGDYNSEVVGEYALTYIAKDSSLNETKASFKLIVKDNPNVILSKTEKDYTIKNYYGITYIDDVIIANKSYKLPSNYIPNNLVTINGYIKVIDYVKDAFDDLKNDADNIGLNIYASSGYRSYNDQEYIYNTYVKLDGMESADTYSARAGYSEHQTGLAIDLNTIDMSFDNTKESNWLRDNSYKYGFIIRYPKDKDNITGYMYEPWHIRYVGKDLASKLYNDGNYITLEEYYGIDSKYK